MGLMVCAGVTEEWMMFGSNTGGVLTDYSAPAKAAFREWVWETVRDGRAPPSGLAGSARVFRFRGASTPHEIAAACEGRFPRSVPRRPRRRLVAISFRPDGRHDRALRAALSRKSRTATGYAAPSTATSCSFTSRESSRPGIWPSIGSPARPISTTSSVPPSTPIDRSSRAAIAHSCRCVDSYHVNGKLWCNENDLRTFRVMDVPNVKADQIDRRQTPRGDDRAAAPSTGRRSGRGCGHSYFDMAGGWYDDPRLAEEIRSQVAVADGHSRWTARPPAKWRW